MGNSIPAKDITLSDLETQFNLQFTEDSQFFPEWQIDLARYQARLGSVCTRSSASSLSSNRA